MRTETGHERHEAIGSQSITHLRGEFNSIVSFDEHGVIWAVKQTKSRMEFSVPPEPAPIVFEGLVDFRDGRQVALSPGRPVAQVDLAEVEIQFADPIENGGVLDLSWRRRRSQGLFLGGSQRGLRHLGLHLRKPQQKR
jgi:hypothetical protein